MNDIDYQLEFTAQSAWRLLSMQDKSLLSPSYGCFHYAYWRDKTSEFPDGRFQEAGGTLGLLSLAQFDHLRSSCHLPSSHELRASFTAALINWQKQQYPEGCWDEWYKGERGYAVTAFTVISFGFAAWFMKEHLTQTENDILRDVMTKAGDWLISRWDRIKTNHEAAGAAALALIYQTTGQTRFAQAAKAKADDTLMRQTNEGWFPEIGGLDLGYCSVLLDYIMVYHELTQDQSVIPGMIKLFDFMRPHIHPNLTITAEYGLCLNPYIGRLGVGLLSRHHAPAADLITQFTHHSPGQDGLLPYLADDLRLTRWSNLPVITWLLQDRFNFVSPQTSLNSQPKSGWVFNPEALVASYRSAEVDVFFSPAGGGKVEAYHNGKKILNDKGPELTNIPDNWTVSGYDPGRKTYAEGTQMVMEAPFIRAKFFFPSILQRLVLRFGCQTALGAKLLRSLIDTIRMKKKSAVNQSVAPISGSTTTFSLQRSVSVTENHLQIVDIIKSQSPVINDENVLLGYDIGQGIIQIVEQRFEKCHMLKITKKYNLQEQHAHSWEVTFEPS